MRMDFFGDSYDIVKKFLIQSIAPNADWVAFPMFSHEVDDKKIKAFEQFLGVRVVSKTIISTTTNRVEHLAASAHHRHIFIDPDTGIKLEPTHGANSVKYIFGTELVTLCKGSPERLLLVYDQSVPRGSELKSIREKLAYFRAQNICGFAYVSHACFLILSASSFASKKSYDGLLGSNLPSFRLFTG